MLNPLRQIDNDPIGFAINALCSSLRDDKQFDNVRVAADRSKDHILHVLEFIRSQFPPKATVGNTSTLTWLFSFVSESKSYVFNCGTLSYCGLRSLVCEG